MSRTPAARKVTVEVRVVPHSGEPAFVEKSSGETRRHALWMARHKYRDKARVDLADGSPD